MKPKKPKGKSKSKSTKRAPSGQHVFFFRHGKSLGIPPLKDFPEATRHLVRLLRDVTVNPPRALEEARKQLKRLIIADHAKFNTDDMLYFLLSCLVSTHEVPDYATVDIDHINQIRTLIDGIRDYVKDDANKRPLNFLMIASPGAGKSHFIKCIAAKLRSHDVRAITFNMAGLQTNEDLIPPLDAARNTKVEDKLPLLFLDEFDSKPSNTALLLPLLWDGELNLGQRDLKLGKVVIVLAGSDPNMPAIMNYAKSMRRDVPLGDGKNPKLVDLLSRINGGVVEIPPFTDRSKGIDRSADKVCVAVQLLRNRFGRKLRTVPLSLLRFIANADFRYDVRSIAHLIDLIPFKPNIVDLKKGNLKLPLSDTQELRNSSLSYHLVSDADSPMSVIDLWRRSYKTSVTIPIDTQQLKVLAEGFTDEHFLGLELFRLSKRLESVGS